MSLSNFWTECKAFFKYSETIFIARITMLIGFVTSAVTLMDWSPLYNLVGTDTGLTKNQAMWSGIITFAKGMLDEYARRRGSNL